MYVQKSKLMQIKVYQTFPEQTPRLKLFKTIDFPIKPNIDEIFAVENSLYKVRNVFYLVNEIAIQADVVRGDFRPIVDYNTRDQE